MIEVLPASSNDPNTRRILEDPYTLTQDRAAEPELGAQPDLPWRRGRDIAPELAGIWTTGFVMAMLQHPNRAAQQRITRLRLRQAGSGTPST